ncbi:hypothetical protein QWY93_11820 [Echinicola jeungdonensis]|uniref:Lipoprotein n=1 Tax=Echinicola jeungdonensis TaxID=709343 RepID=A0ABV5J7X6_9BACT|nr:hypothetical protein [Echinicola jeungdonensis]MDN3670015.1 hypothetical protein [Echinicola jeungdonensis]
MKKNPIYLIGLLLILVACSPKKGNQFSGKGGEGQKTIASSNSQFSPEEILLEEIPKDISHNVKKDNFFSSLDLVNAKKIKKEGKVFYDLTFEDEESLTIMATFNENGQIVVL